MPWASPVTSKRTGVCCPGDVRQVEAEVGAVLADDGLRVAVGVQVDGELLADQVELALHAVGGLHRRR